MALLRQVCHGVAYMAAITLGLLLGLSPCHLPPDKLGWSSLAAFGVMVAASLLSGRERDEEEREGAVEVTHHTLDPTSSSGSR
jgi:hypothetical protein